MGTRQDLVGKVKVFCSCFWRRSPAFDYRQMLCVAWRLVVHTSRNLQWWPNHLVSEKWLAQLCPFMPHVVVRNNSAQYRHCASLFIFFYFSWKNNGNISRTSSYLHVIIHQMLLWKKNGLMCCGTEPKAMKLCCQKKKKAMKLMFLGCTRSREPIGSDELGRTTCCSLVSTATPTRTCALLFLYWNPHTNSGWALIWDPSARCHANKLGCLPSRVPTCSCIPGEEVMWFVQVSAFCTASFLTHPSTIAIQDVSLSTLEAHSTLHSVQQHCWILGEWVVRFQILSSTHLHCRPRNWTAAAMERGIIVQLW